MSTFPAAPAGPVAVAIQHQLEKAVQLATAFGYVVTVEQVPLQPLAMGHYETRVSMRVARELTK